MMAVFSWLEVLSIYACIVTSASFRPMGGSATQDRPNPRLAKSNFDRTKNCNLMGV